MKKRSCIYIDADLLEFAKKNKINVSKLVEKALLELKNPNTTRNHQVAGSNPAGGLCLCLELGVNKVSISYLRQCSLMSMTHFNFKMLFQSIFECNVY
jgi:hypothetical protein